MKRYAVLVDGAPLVVPSGATPYTLVRHGGDSNTEFAIEDVVNAIGRPLTAREDDFLDLLHSLHITDLICARGRNEEWTRDITLAVPLRDPAYFSPLIPLIQEIFGMMTFDRLRLNLSHYDEHPKQRYPSRVSASAAPDAVCLLSGGLDSACAGAALAQEFAHPAFVSSRSSSHVIAAQDHVTAALSKKCSGLTSVHFRSRPKHQHPVAPLPASDVSQRSRTLLYIGIAAMIAAAHGLQNVTLGENGIMAINCPLTLGRAAGFSTRTAHPDVLAKIESLCSEVLQAELSVVNPLLLLTKADVVKRLVKLCGAGIVKRTHSCWIARQAHHCGYCVPCIVRRFATEAAQVSDIKYVGDAFAKPGQLAADAFASVGDYLLFVRKLRSAPDADLEFDYPDLNIGHGATMDQLIALHKKWAAQVEGVIKKHPALRALY